MGYNNGNSYNNYAIVSIIKQLGLGANIRVHFQGQTHTGKYAGLNNGVLILNRSNNETAYFPVNQITAIDVI
ncbi:MULTISPECIES: hypothetical protein [Paenibacillus]|uniref:Uncharacterized protein n=1 Tax=Paenibacillus tundrae TaxID=528187 RepID=A0ABT9WHP1_9BACL|nr:MULTISPECIES: hypothetical protein [Paenibacillus]KQY79906.1 hypothetical protein ASD24_18355 [Paenibacillus sp. Root52]MDQ0172737.1 hypothetical protein [Paenibacillus tundrae]